MASEQKTKTNSDQQTRILPKNFRQIGEPGTKKIYMEDYVYTYFINAEKAGSMSFVVRLGTNVWVPTSEANLANASYKVDAPSRFDTVANVEYPFTFK